MTRPEWILTECQAAPAGWPGNGGPPQMWGMAVRHASGAWRAAGPINEHEARIQRQRELQELTEPIGDIQPWNYRPMTVHRVERDLLKKM